MFTTDTGVENFYVFDGTIGNILALINAAGVVTATYSYDPYGNYSTTSSTGSAAGLNPYRTAGGLYDRTTNFIKYGQRWYNPATGRFTQQDSIEHLTNPKHGNRYAYAADNPTNNVDPSGRNTALSTLTLCDWGLCFGVSYEGDTEGQGAVQFSVGAGVPGVCPMRGGSPKKICPRGGVGKLRAVPVPSMAVTVAAAFSVLP